MIRHIGCLILIKTLIGVTRLNFIITEIIPKLSIDPINKSIFLNNPYKKGIKQTEAAEFLYQNCFINPI